MPATNQKLTEIKQQTAKDDTLQLLKTTMMEGWPNTKSDSNNKVKPFWDSRSELTEIDGLILKGQRIVIPAKMQQNVLKRIHVGHLGMERSKR